MFIPEHPYTARERTVCRILADMAGARSLLNVGMRNPTDPRNQWWLKICRSNGIEPHVLEVFEPNCAELRAYGVPRVTCGDVRDIGRIFRRNFDIVLWWHGPEHVEKTEAARVLQELAGLADQAVIVGSPLGHEPQDACYGNDHERHRSAWQLSDFTALGFEAEAVHDGRAYAHVTAWKFIGFEPSPPTTPEHAGSAEPDTPSTVRPVTIRRVAVIFDDQPRPETTGTYCRRALDGLVEVRHVRPADLGHLNPNDFDLFLRIDDGLEYRLPRALRPCAWWAIDTHLDFAGCLATAREFDLVFAAQRDGADRLREEGIRSARWLPLACDPAVHAKHDVPKAFDVCFVGTLFPGPRSELVGLIRRRFPNSFVGQRYFAEMAETYSASRIVFNRSIRNDVNMRVFEALACGSLLITNDLRDNGQAELFQSGVHLETYRDPEELLDKIAFYLRHEAAQERIAAAGRAEVLARHTYHHRMEELLRAAEQWLSQTAVTTVSGPSPQSSRNGRRKPPGSQGARLVRDRSYFEFARPELLALVPESARRVLDIGCGAGRLGEAIKARQGAEVVGVELDEHAARAARDRLDRVLVGNVEEIELEFPRGHFDSIVCGDILEHLVDPGRLVGRTREWLAPGGRLIASIPNVRHHSVVRSLLDGNWTYESAGLLDRDHVRFFTRREIETLFQGAGYTTEAVHAVPGSGYAEWEQSGRPGSVSVGQLHISDLPPEAAEEFYIYQFLVVAKLQNGVLPVPAATTPTVRRSGQRRMRFTQNFLSDFDEFDFHGEPFAFVRFGDGERAICEARPIEAQDGWTYDGRSSPFVADLNAALGYHAPDYYIGISDACCDRPSKDWFLAQLTLPLDQVTFANIFVNWNYRRFRQLDLSHAVIVSNGGGDFWVPPDLVSSRFDLDALLEQLLHVDQPILLAAGPASCIIAHKYWMRADPSRRQTIVDVGSAIDERTKGRKTRMYQYPGTRTAELICTW